MTHVAVITIAHGRHDHWITQQHALDLSSMPVHERILVVMDDPELVKIATQHFPHTTVIELPTTSTELPLAQARNAGARRALQNAADVLVFLDADCLPSPNLLSAYTSAATREPWRDYLLSGSVTYLPPPPREGYDVTHLWRSYNPHPVRPAPLWGEISPAPNNDLFWSLSFAVSKKVWQRIGGFYEGYSGYGGEDTDFGRTAQKIGIPMAWVGKAHAYHQHHPVQDPPRQHLQSILRNATLFRKRWGDWPMKGWLDAFVREGLLTRSDEAGYQFANPNQSKR